MKNSIWILLLILGFLACNDDDVVFNPVTEGLEIKFEPVAGGAMMRYSLPNDRNIFAMNVRYKNWQGNDVLAMTGAIRFYWMVLRGLWTWWPKSLLSIIAMRNPQNGSIASQPCPVRRGYFLRTWR